MVWNLSCHFPMILIFICETTNGIKWITEPLLVNKCKGQTINLMWEYVEEPGEEITQLQWIFNRTELIAYSSLNQGFNIEPKYQRRVNQSSSKTGIMLHNISSKDSGTYTLYPLVKWEERPNVQTVQLNVIEAAMEPGCSCTKLSVVPEERNGQTYRIEVGNCTLEIKSSVCCPVGLVYQYCVNDPSKFCIPIWTFNNVTESIIEKLSISLHNQQNIIYSVLVICSMCLCVTIIMMVRLICVLPSHCQMKSKKRKKRKAYMPEEGQQEEVEMFD